MSGECAVLNPLLYNKLRVAFPQGVKICNLGQKMISGYNIEEGRLKLNISYWGESYRVCCFNCGDSRYRLYISHKYGEFDEFTQKPNYNLFICFNEQCQKDPKVRQELYRRLYLSNFDGVELLINNSSTEDIQSTREIFYPEKIIPVSGNLELILKIYPEIYAYLLKKSGGKIEKVEEIAKKYYLGVCVQSSKKYLENGLFMPVVFEEKVVGWQIRTFLPEKHFWSSPGIKNYFYCSPESMLYKTIILCEGPGDVWAIGDEALGLFGKTISVHQLDLLKTKYANTQKIVVLLDGDAVEDAYKLAYTIKSSMPEKEIIVAELPPDRDPGDLSREEIIKWIKSSQKKI